MVKYKRPISYSFMENELADIEKESIQFADDVKFGEDLSVGVFRDAMSKEKVSNVPTETSYGQIGQDLTAQRIQHRNNTTK